MFSGSFHWHFPPKYLWEYETKNLIWWGWFIFCVDLRAHIMPRTMIIAWKITLTFLKATHNWNGSFETIDNVSLAALFDSAKMPFDIGILMLLGCPLFFHCTVRWNLWWLYTSLCLSQWDWWVVVNVWGDLNLLASIWSSPVAVAWIHSSELELAAPMPWHMPFQKIQGKSTFHNWDNWV